MVVNVTVIAHDPAVLPRVGSEAVIVLNYCSAIISNWAVSSLAFKNSRHRASKKLQLCVLGLLLSLSLQASCYVFS